MNYLLIMVMTIGNKIITAFCSYRPNGTIKVEVLYVLKNIHLLYSNQ